MTLAEFNAQYARYELKHPDLSTQVKVLTKLDTEWQIEVAGRVIWAAIRKDTSKPKAPSRWLSEPIIKPTTGLSSLPKRDLNLNPSSFKFLVYLRSLDVPIFTLSEVSEQIGLSSKTLYTCLQELTTSGHVKYTRCRSTMQYTLTYLEKLTDAHN